MIKVKDLEGRFVATEKKICEELNINFKNVFTVEDTLWLMITRWMGDTPGKLLRLFENI